VVNLADCFVVPPTNDALVFLPVLASFSLKKVDLRKPKCLAMTRWSWRRRIGSCLADCFVVPPRNDTFFLAKDNVANQIKAFALLPLIIIMPFFVSLFKKFKDTSPPQYFSCLCTFFKHSPRKIRNSTYCLKIVNLYNFVAYFKRKNNPKT
jgi:hypothetical protein